MIEDRLTLNFEIAERLRRARTAADLSLAQVADRTDGRISVSTISNYERGQRRVGIEEARLLAKALGTVTPAYLLCVETALPLAPDERDLLARYRETDAWGRTLVMQKAMAEVDRTKGED